MNVAGYDPEAGKRTTDRETIWIVAWNLENALEAVEEYASHVHTYRNGWESSWPLTFRVRLPDGTTEDYEVARETVPSFKATKVTGG